MRVCESGNKPQLVIQPGVEISRINGLALLLALLPTWAFAQFKDENLVMTPPPGYKVGYVSNTDRLLMVEMVPQNETVEQWTEMMTVQVFTGMRQTPETIQTSMERKWLAACKDGESSSIRNGRENGYPFALWLLSCPMNPSAGKLEMTWLKAISGNDNLYLVRKAFKFEPDKEQIVHWMKYFSRIQACDSRLEDRPCPTLESMIQ